MEKIKCELFQVQRQMETILLELKQKKKNVWVTLFGVLSLFCKVTFLMAVQERWQKEKVNKI